MRWDRGHRRYLLKRSNHESFGDLAREWALLYCPDLHQLTLDYPSLRVRWNCKWLILFGVPDGI